METYSKKLDLIHECVQKLTELRRQHRTLASYRAAWRDKDAAERNLQKAVEAMIDIGKMIISEKKLREPGNSRDVFLSLAESGIFPIGDMDLIDKMVGMRNIIVHSYDKIDDSTIYAVLKKNLADITRIAGHLTRLAVKRSKTRLKERP